MKNSKIILTVVLISISAAKIIAIFKGESNGIFEIIGSAAAFILAPFFITSMIIYGFKFTSWRWNFEDKRFSRVFITMWFIWVLLGFFGSAS